MDPIIGRFENNRLLPVTTGKVEQKPLTSPAQPGAAETTPQDNVTLGGSSTPDSHMKLTILHTNDMHGHVNAFKDKSKPDTEIGGLSSLASTVKEERARNPQGTLLLDAGDISTGTPLSDMFHAEPMILAMNEMGYDAMTIGNHEMDKGKASLQNLTRQANFPILSANFVDLTNGADPVDVKPYTMKEVNGVKVGILGLTTPDSLTMLAPEDRKQIDFLTTTDTARRMVPKMRAEGADVIIALTHIGVDEDRKLAEQVPGIDVIVGGHSHTEMPILEKVGDTHIVQTGKFGKNLGKLELDVSRENGKVTVNEATSKLISINEQNTGKDPEIEATLAPYREKLESVMGRVAGQAEKEIDYVHHDTINRETGICDFVTDAVREHTGADVCLFPPSSFRSALPQGDVKVEDIYTMFPWDDGLSMVNMKGKDIKNVVEAGLGKEVLEVAPSGLQIKYDMSRPQGDRVIEISTNNGKPLDMEKDYKVAVRNFPLDSQGDYMEYKNFTDRKPLQDTVQDIIIDAFGKGPVAGGTDGRLKEV